MAVIRMGLSGASPMARLGKQPFLRYLEHAERLGWDSIWFSDRIVGQAWTVDPIVAMAMIAAHTEKLKFGTGVLLMSMRSPVATARALSTIDALSNGRLILGVGVGQESPLEYDAMGVKKEERGARLNEAIRVMRMLWTQERVTFEGKFLKLTDAGINPMPIQRPIPIWIGGRTDAALRRTGRLGDGWLPTQVTPEDAAKAIKRIQEYAAEVGRRVPDDHFGVQLGCYVVEHGQVPADKVAPYALTRRSDVKLDQIHLLGTPNQISARIREFVDAGVTKFVFTPACPPEEMHRQVELQMELVVKHFHALRV